MGLLGGAGIARVDLTSRAVDQSFALGSGFGPLYANDIEVLPGSADVIAVSLKVKGSSPNHAGVAIFDNGVKRPNVTPGHTGSNVIEAASASTLYGYKNSSSGFWFYTLTVDADGVTRTDSTKTAISGFSVDIAYDDGRIYGSNGAVIDALTKAHLGTFQASSVRRPQVTGGEVHLWNGLGDSGIKTFSTATFVQVGDTQSVYTPAGVPHGFVHTPFGFFVWTTEAYGYAAAAPPMGWIEGVVTAEDTGLAVHSVCVAITDGLSTVETTTTNEDGYYSMRLPAGTYYVLFAECQFLDYFSEWFDDRSALGPDPADPVVVTEGAFLWVGAELAPLFTDVPRNSFYFADVIWLRLSGITTGCGSGQYCPDSPVTREEMAAFIARIWRLFGGTCSSSGLPFHDVPESSFAFDDIACIRSLGITTGTSPTTYSPNELVTRGQMAAFLARLWEAFGRDCPVVSLPFTDVPTTFFARDGVSCIYDLGITTGTSPTTYSPTHDVTRSQMAAFIARMGRLLSV